MPTVGSITRQTEMLGQLSHKLFRLDMAAADNSILVGGAIETGANLLQSEFGGQPALTTMVENYTEEKSAFRSEIQDAMNNLQRSSEQLKNSVQSESGASSQEVSASEESGETETSANPSQEVSRNNTSSQERNIFSRATVERAQVRQEQVRPEPRTENNFQKFAENYLVSEDDEDEQENSAEQAESQDDRLTSVQNFVRDYNNAVSYLNENKFSQKISPLSQNDELTKSLNEIGISVNSSGELSVDEKTLSAALQNNSEKVGETFGSDGLAGQLEKEVDRVNQRSENLFPSIVDYANQRETDLAAESLYSARNMSTAAYYGVHAGNLINTFT